MGTTTRQPDAAVLAIAVDVETTVDDARALIHEYRAAAKELQR